MRRTVSFGSNSNALRILKWRIDDLDRSLAAVESAINEGPDGAVKERVRCYKEIIGKQRHLLREAELASNRDNWDLVKRNVDMICQAALIIQLDCGVIMSDSPYMRAG